jgi:hypothetical protein
MALPQFSARSRCGASNTPILGQCYTRNEIADTHGGGRIEYLPNVAGRIVCACLRTDPAFNPEAPHVILPGRGPKREHWAEVLGEQEGPIPVYLKRAPSRWEYVGDYEVERWSRSPEEIEEREAQTGRPVTSVIYMRPAR